MKSLQKQVVAAALAAEEGGQGAKQKKALKKLFKAKVRLEEIGGCKENCVLVDEREVDCRFKVG